MKQAVVYIHGKGGNKEEAEHYRALFTDGDVIGLDYKAQTPWQAKEEFSTLFAPIKAQYEKIVLIANSIGVYFAMVALSDAIIDEAYFISPVVDMEKLIKNMMSLAGVTETELEIKGEIKTNFGETLSWKYLSYVRENPVEWNVKTHILYGDKDGLTSRQTVKEFAKQTNSTLTVMKGGEHWFHTKEQMEFLDRWIKKYRKKEKIVVDEEVELVPYYPNYKRTLPWYQDITLVKQIDNVEKPYDLATLKGMYNCLDESGELYYIKYKNRLVGDISIWGGKIGLAICKEYQNKHIGRRAVKAMTELAKRLGWEKVQAEIYSFNGQSQKMFRSVGFQQIAEEWYEYIL